MSSRAFKRAQQAQQLQQESVQHDAEDESDDESPVVSKKPGNAFAMFLATDGDGAQSDDDDDGPESITDEEIDKQPEPNPNARKKKTKKKKKGRHAASVTVNSVPDDEQEALSDDDLDAQLKKMELLDQQTNVQDEQSPKEKRGKSETERYNVVAVNRNFLNPENEMRRLFGSSTINEQARNRTGNRTRYIRKFWLCQPKPTWPPWANPGLHMEKELGAEDDALYSFKHGKAYKEVEKVFLQAVDSLDPNNIVAILNRHPCHIDSLLQLAEVCNIQGDRQTAADLIERVLYIHESCLHSRFRMGDPQTSKLLYRNYENRGFFLGLYHHSEKLAQKGCWRTALEVCKVLYSLEERDPLGSLLLIDCYALQSREYQWLLQFDRANKDRHLHLLPNFAFSLALAAFQAEWDQRHELGSDVSGGVVLAGDTDSTTLLENALLMFPDMLAPLVAAAEIEINTTLLFNPFFRETIASSTIGNADRAILGQIQLYVARTSKPWKEPMVAPWVRATMAGVVAKINSKPALVDENRLLRESAFNGEGSRDIARHIVLSGNPEALATLPDEVKNESTRMFDPLPPLDGISPYKQQHSALITDSTQSALNLFLRSIMPSFGVEEAQRLVTQQDDGDGNGLVLNVELLRDMLANFHQEVGGLLQGNEDEGHADDE
ncbi:hypothetical protein SARC_04427 [Sphaeroforma arctica JP610]|uniref:Transcription factor 25 n=1 Tax=Sphaeroforma arctica JP610 TaxID=667725 RepID=A0A0L0G2H1_9EUKA|nr:hypothetical protein SARC_04427 [Sphaeroforma arctica JP610]KNC83332.1 hypothetical protein SARC_04427 [Sphaeroforma arctica JP610]|eukprot:XP_014157234.1 hypothetical protein SARC_04427 [Sphaeroforma arctica JP610]